MGYIDLLTPVTHIWYLKGVPSYLSCVLKNKRSTLEEIIYFEPFSKIDFKDPLKINPVGGEVILNLLKNINLIENIKSDRRELITSRNQIIRKLRTRRIRVLENFLNTNSKPEWMVLTVLPVIPPGLRPIVQLETKHLAVSDLNKLYRKVMERNDRIGKLVSAYAPAEVLLTEKRLLQEAVDALIDNGKHGIKAVDMESKSINKRLLKSLANTIEGKQGRFRQNLLGKRVDYSGRSVIVVEPDLELNQCGLPYDMAVELFCPFIIHELINLKLVQTIISAKKIIQSNEPFLWNLVNKVIQNHPILLNRAPTLHRLGIQAFEPILIRGKAILLHPLVCPAFNADFDGDQMAIHIPLSLEAQTEARVLLSASNNFLSPATGEPMIQPTQDMLLGLYYLTINNRPRIKGSNHYFRSFEDVTLAYSQKQIDLHSSIWVQCKDIYEFSDKLILIKEIRFEDKSLLKVYNNLQRRESNEKEFIVQYIRTTPGRIILNQILNIF